jgi:hypothetical protein
MKRHGILLLIKISLLGKIHKCYATAFGPLAMLCTFLVKVLGSSAPSIIWDRFPYLRFDAFLSELYESCELTQEI